jgi:hypothetical protein
MGKMSVTQRDFSKKSAQFYAGKLGIVELKSVGIKNSNYNAISSPRLPEE